MVGASVAGKRKAAECGFSPCVRFESAECTAWPCPPAFRS
nr:MAG TPA_asm: hypothetical protein [Caudoviricetes sp.]